MSIAGDSTIEALPDPVFMIETVVLLEIEGGVLVPLKSTGASSVRSCLISDGTTGALGVGTVMASCVTISRTYFTTRVFYAGAWTELSSALVLVIGSFA